MTSTDPHDYRDDIRHDREFVNDTEAVIRLGSMLLSSGTGSYRVKRAMSDAGLALGIDRLDASVSLTEITATAHRGDNFRTVAREVYRVRVDSSRIAALEDLAHNLPAGTTGRELESRLMTFHVRCVPSGQNGKRFSLVASHALDSPSSISSLLLTLS